jgi:hypothetical protein
MSENFYLSGAALCSANNTYTLIEYQVNSQQRLKLNYLSIDLNPVTYFNDIYFTLYINNRAQPYFSSINSQITQSYYPMNLNNPILVEPGWTIIWQIVCLSSLGSNTVNAFASLQGEIEAI